MAESFDYHINKYSNILELKILKGTSLSKELLDIITENKNPRLNIRFEILKFDSDSIFTINLPSDIVQNLEIYGYSDINIDINNLPFSLKMLSICGCNIKSLDYLPLPLETLKLYNQRDIGYKFDNLPVNLKNLSLGIRDFQGSLENLPDSLEVLHVDYLLSKKDLSSNVLHKITVPKNLTLLSINVDKNFEINLENLPDSLEYLEINCNPIYLEHIQFPKNLKYLAINNEIELDYDNLPKSLEKLFYFNEFDGFYGYCWNNYELFDKINVGIKYPDIDMKNTFQKIRSKNYSFNIYVYNYNAEESD